MNVSVKEQLKSHEERMKKAIEVLRREYSTMRAGRANPSILDKITVDYYGAPTPINQTANISVPDPRTLLIAPWDKSNLKAIEKAILKSDLGMTPNNDGTVIRLTVPQLTQERRKELVRAAQKKAEETRVAVRNLRRDGNDVIKKLEKDKQITEDEAKKGQEEMQKLTDRYVKEIDGILAGKEKEIMEV
ncbi:MAG: ribosome recycling factor [Negativicutes bacterium]|nr:ribosome recycling factor [Negativicutes bacterium]